MSIKFEFTYLINLNLIMIETTNYEGYRDPNDPEHIRLTAKFTSKVEDRPVSNILISINLILAKLVL